MGRGMDGERRGEHRAAIVLQVQKVQPRPVRSAATGREGGGAGGSSARPDRDVGTGMKMMDVGEEEWTCMKGTISVEGDPAETFRVFFMSSASQVHVAPPPP